MSENYWRQGRPAPEWFDEQIRKLLKRGARAGRLVEDAPELLEALVPPSEDGRLSPMERALRLEAVLRECIILTGKEFTYTTPVGEAMLALYGLNDGAPTGPTALAVRTEQAAVVMGIKPRTFRRLHRDGYIADLADKLYERYYANHAAS